MLASNNFFFSHGFSPVFRLYCGGQCTYPCFPIVLLTCSSHNIPTKPLAAFPDNKSAVNDYHQSSEVISAEPRIEPATSCSQVLYAMGKKRE